MFLSIVIPAKNEEARIFSTLGDYLKVFPQAEFIVVVNNSSDQTEKIVADFAKSHPRVKHINIPQAIGKGGAVQAGFKLARGNLVGFVDADGSTAPLQFQRLVGQINSYDAVIASRWVKGAKFIRPQSVSRRLLSRIFNLAVRLIVGLPYRDTQCGAKVFRQTVIQEVLPQLKVKNFAFDVEILYLCKRCGFEVKEVPIEWEDKEGSTLGILKNLGVIKSLLEIRLRVYG